MRLINTETLKLEEWFNNIPPYAILSHTWGTDEVSFADWQSGLEVARKREGFRKIELTCQQAAHDKYKYAWVDTNCIDKTSSSELSEAINSMFAWYRDAQVCYVFLKDVVVSAQAAGAGTPVPTVPPGTAPPGSADKKYLDDPGVRKAFKASAWFTRGWTLQELLAPSKILFFSYEWLPLATKESERRLISDITDINVDYIKRPEDVYKASVARRMSWMARRRTTRVEDTAYCLLGLFGIHMALLYGEGHRAFLRLQEEIIRVSNDQTIFCWQANKIGRLRPATLIGSEDFPPMPGAASSSTTPPVPADQDTHRQAELEQWTSILAPHPKVFRDSSLYFSEFGNAGGGGGGGTGAGGSSTSSNGTSLGPGTGLGSPSTGTADVGPYSITNFGLSISLPLLYTAKGACAVLDVSYRRTSNDQASRVVIPLHRVQGDHYIRLSTQLFTMIVPPTLIATRTQIFVDCRNAPSPHANVLLGQRVSARPVNMEGDAKDKHHPVLFLTFNRPVDMERIPLAASDMDFVPFHSAIEVNNHRLGTQSAVVLSGKAAGSGSTITVSSSGATESFHLLVGGRSSQAAMTDNGATSHGQHGILPRSLSSPLSMVTASPGTPNSISSSKTFAVLNDKELSMDWHVDVWSRPAASFSPMANGDSTSLKLLIDRLSTEYFGSWCTSQALCNVLSWRYASGGALVCYFELGELCKASDGDDGTSIANPERKATPTTLPGNDDELVQFSHLRRCTFEMSSMQQLYNILEEQQNAKRLEERTLRVLKPIPRDTVTEEKRAFRDEKSVVPA